jgi:hypothetical protein
MALKSCNEIGSAKTLYQFVLDLSKESEKFPSQPSMQMIKTDHSFRKFLCNVIVCTEQGYNDADLITLAHKDYRTDFKTCYIDLISKVIEELLIENKINKLQTFGYVLEKNINSSKF